MFDLMGHIQSQTDVFYNFIQFDIAGSLPLGKEAPLFHATTQSGSCGTGALQPPAKIFISSGVGVPLGVFKKRSFTTASA